MVHEGRSIYMDERVVQYRCRAEPSPRSALGVDIVLHLPAPGGVDGGFARFNLGPQLFSRTAINLGTVNYEGPTCINLNLSPGALPDTTVAALDDDEPAATQTSKPLLQIQYGSGSGRSARAAPKKVVAHEPGQGMPTLGKKKNRTFAGGRLDVSGERGYRVVDSRFAALFVPPDDDVASSTQDMSKRVSERDEKPILALSAPPRSGGDGSQATNGRDSAMKDNLKKDAGSVSVVILTVVATLYAVRDCAARGICGGLSIARAAPAIATRSAISRSRHNIVRSLLVVALAVGGGLVVAVPAARNAAACAELGGEAFGCSRVCGEEIGSLCVGGGESDAHPLAGCAGIANWTAAREACEAPGAQTVGLHGLSDCGFADEHVIISGEQHAVYIKTDVTESSAQAAGAESIGRRSFNSTAVRPLVLIVAAVMIAARFIQKLVCSIRVTGTSRVDPSSSMRLGLLVVLAALKLAAVCATSAAQSEEIKIPIDAYEVTVLKPAKRGPCRLRTSPSLPDGDCSAAVFEVVLINGANNAAVQWELETITESGEMRIGKDFDEKNYTWYTPSISADVQSGNMPPYQYQVLKVGLARHQRTTRDRLI